MAGFHLTLFGSPELREAGGSVVRLRTQKQLGLLVYLALEARVRAGSRDTVVDLLWSEAPEPQARHSLSQALSAIRSALGDSSVQGVRDSIRLVAPLTTDLERERIADITGDLTTPLRDLDRCAGADFAQWVETMRERCLKHVRDTLTREVERARASGDVSAVHEQALSLYAVDPGSDLAAHVLTERELLRGDSPQAIRLLRRHLERAEREMGRSPADLKRLLRRIENGGHRKSPPGLETALVLRAPEEAFVGRESELAELERAWDEARKGAFAGCLVTGDTGIGKSALVRRFATSITARGAPVLVVSCQEIGSAIPFAVVSDLIHELMREPGLHATDPVWLSEASRVYPALRSHFPGVPEPPTVPGEAIRLRVAEALFHMIEAVSDSGPVLLVMDDVPLADPASLESVHALTRRLDRSAFMLVGTQRTAAAGLGGTAGDALGRAWTHTLALKPLSAEDMRHLVAHLCNNAPELDQRVRSEIVSLSSGNAYFAELLLTDWKKHSRESLVASRAIGSQPPETWQPPDTLRVAFARQSGKLDLDSRELLNFLAVAGRALPPLDIAALLSWDGVRVDKSVLQLLQDGVVRFDQGRVGFKNELHRAFVYYAMPIDLRRYSHRRIANALMESEKEQRHKAQLHAAFHFLQAAMIDEAVATTIQGSMAAIEQGAPGEAATAIAAVLEHANTQDAHRLNLLIAQALAAQGRYPEALEALSRWNPANPDRTDVALAARIRAELMVRPGVRSDDPQAAAAVKRAVAAARLSRRAPQIIAAMQLQAEAAARDGDSQTLSRIARATLRIGRHEGEATQALATLTRGYCLMNMGDFEAGGTAFSASANRLESLGLQTELRRALNGIGICFTAIGKFTEAANTYRRALPIVDQTGDAHLQSLIWTNLAVVHNHTGFFNEAVQCTVTALEASKRSPMTLTLSQAHQGAAALAITLGRTDQADQLLSISEEALGKRGIGPRHCEVMLERADWHLARKEDELAWPLVEAVIRQNEGLLRPMRLSGFARLRLHWTLRTRGYEVMMKQHEVDLGMLQKLPLSERISRQAFVEWATREEEETLGDARSTTGSTIELVAKHGLFGVLARLAAVHTCPVDLPEPRAGETSAQLIARLFPDTARGVPPSGIPILANCRSEYKK